MSKKTSLDDMKVGRRTLLTGIGATLGTVALGCGEDADRVASSPQGAQLGGAGGTLNLGGANGSGGTPLGSGGGDGVGGQGGDTPVDECADTGGLTAEELLAPITTIVVLCMENRSFDHYLGSLKSIEGRLVDGLSGDESNPKPNGSTTAVFNLDDYTPADPPHDWDAVHSQWGNGSNDGFVAAHAGDDEDQVMGFYVRSQLPITYALADSFSVCDRWFCSVLGPTWPNRYYLHGATSNGQKGNSPAGVFKSIFEVLKDNGNTAKNYFHDLAWATGGYLKLNDLSTIEKFFQDAENGNLPNFCIIDPQFLGAGANDDHPDHDVRLGQALIGSVVAALAKSPQWNECLLVITYDEHGGFYDHVPPPATIDDDPEFAQLGFRVPTIVAGPFVRKGCVVSTQFEHVSIISTLTKRFGLEPLNARVSATADLSSCIDPRYLSDPQPAPELPTVDISLSELDRRTERKVSQPELHALAERGMFPKHLDRRAEGAQIARRVLREGERLGVVRLRP